MNRHSVTSVILSAALLLAPAGPTLAQTNLLKGTLQGVLNDVIQNEVSKAQQRTTTSTATSTREENRQVQMALNHFGYPVGSADGILGRRSRAAIAQYQNANGYRATGTLTGTQRSGLLSTWRQSLSGVPLDATGVLGAAIGAGALLPLDSKTRSGRRRPGAATATTINPATTGGSVVTDPNTTTRRATARTTVGTDQNPSQTGLGAGTTRILPTTRAINAQNKRGTSRTSVAATTPPATGSTTATTTQPVVTRSPAAGANDTAIADRARLRRCVARGISLVDC